MLNEVHKNIEFVFGLMNYCKLYLCYIIGIFEKIWTQQTYKLSGY